MCPSVATDLHTGERAKTGCLGGKIMFLDVARKRLSRRQNNVSECSD